MSRPAPLGVEDIPEVQRLRQQVADLTAALARFAATNPIMVRLWNDGAPRVWTCFYCAADSLQSESIDDFPHAAECLWVSLHVESETTT